MNDANQKLKNIINPKIVWVLVGMVLVSFYVGGLAYLKYQKNSLHTVSPDFITFKNLPNDVIVTTTLKNKSGIYDLPFKNSTIILPQNVIDNFTVPYEVKAQLKTKDGDIKDIKWELDKKGVFYTLTLDGFLPNEKVFLKMNDLEVNDLYFTDWSGRIKLDLAINTKIDLDICVGIPLSSLTTFCTFFKSIKDEF